MIRKIINIIKNIDFRYLAMTSVWGNPVALAIKVFWSPDLPYGGQDGPRVGWRGRGGRLGRPPQVPHGRLQEEGQHMLCRGCFVKSHL